MSSNVIDFIYLIASGLLIAGIWQFMKPGRSRQGNLLGGAGLLLAVLATLAARGLYADGSSASWMASFVTAIVGLAAGIGIGAFFGLKANQENALPRISLLVAALGFATALIAGTYFHNLGAAHDAVVAEANKEWEGLPEAVRRANQKGSPILIVAWNDSLAAGLAATLGGAIAAAGVISFLKLTKSTLRKMLPRLDEPAMPQVALIVVCMLLTLLLMAWPGTETFLWLMLIAAMTLGYLLTIHLKIVDVPPVLAACVALSGLSLTAAGLVIGNLLMVTSGAIVTSGGAVIAQSLSQSLNVSLLGLVRGLESSKTAVSEEAEETPKVKTPPPPPAARTNTPDPNAPIL
jgi:H+-translocating NAD(P) transhydrogenase subunit beta